LTRQDKALAAALDYIPLWVGHQMRINEQPGCSFAVAQHGKLVTEFALGHSGDGRALTPRHRFRVASHSKTFTAAAVLRLRELGRWQLDDAVGRYVPGLHKQVAAATLAQLLSHSAGLVRDGADAAQWSDRGPFLDEAALRADLAGGPVITPNTRLKYSNHGYGLLGLAIAHLTGEPYNDWVAREIVAPSGLVETTPDMPAVPNARARHAVHFAQGHSAKWPLGRRQTIPGDNSTNALASATGFVSTAADLVKFFSSLAPDARHSVLSPASRREMLRRHWRDAYGSVERWYGLGTISGATPGAGGDWDWFGHTGGFQGTLSRTVCLPQQGLCISALSNAADGQAHLWVDGAVQIIRTYLQHGAPTARTAAWAGRWWSLWGAFDLLPMRSKVLVAMPSLANPVMDATQIEPSARQPSQGRITLAGSFGSHGEAAQLELDAAGRASAVWLAATRLQAEPQAAKELAARYKPAPVRPLPKARSPRR
jgi:D-alanyl-D-alanine carboxypeptidase